MSIPAALKSRPLKRGFGTVEDSLKRPLGHGQVRAWLGSVLKSRRVSGSYLFVGPTGIGKQALAVEFAAALRCASPVEGWACGRCNECVRVAHGVHPNVRRYAKPDDSRDLPVELVRTICDDASLSRLEPGYRVAIINDADRFNESSANAFLKTLEEPPAQYVFILLAANSAQLLATILSRCQMVRFSPLSAADLARVVSGFEGMPASPEERELLLRVAQGSPGRVAEMLALNVPALAGNFSSGLAADPFRAAEQLVAALSKDLPAELGTEGLRERLRDVMAVLSADLRDRLMAALGMHDVAPLARRHSHEATSADALVAALNRLEALRERIDANANVKLACDLLALRYPV